MIVIIKAIMLKSKRVPERYCLLKVFYQSKNFAFGKLCVFEMSLMQNAILANSRKFVMAWDISW